MALSLIKPASCVKAMSPRTSGGQRQDAPGGDLKIVGIPKELDALPVERLCRMHQKCSLWLTGPRGLSPSLPKLPRGDTVTWIPTAWSRRTKRFGAPRQDSEPSTYKRPSTGAGGKANHMCRGGLSRLELDHSQNA